MLEALEERTLPTAGLIDTSFNSPNGYFIFNDLTPDSANSLAIQQDGKVVVSLGPAVARLNADGTPDPTFATGGRFSLGSLGTSSAVAIQPDGKIVVAGNNSGDFEVIRLNADGSPDANFANNGAGRFSFSTGGDNAYAVTLQSDGKIVVAGSANNSNLGGTICLLRLGGNGLLDSSFGTGGFVINSASGSSGRANGLCIQPDGKILVAGTNIFPNYCSLVRFNANGTLDASFGSSGEILETPGSIGDGNTGVLVRPDGSILTSGSLYSGGEIFAYTSAGARDLAFGDYINGQRTGTVITADRLNGLVQEADGKIIVYGPIGSGPPGSFAISRYTAAGDLDTSFGTNQGHTYLSFPDNANIGEARAAVLQTDGKLVVAGGEQPTGAFMTPVVARLTGEGPPIANDDGTMVAENTDSQIAVLANDSDTDDTPIDPATVTIVAGPGHGTAAVNAATGVVDYTPSANFLGSDSFTYSVKDTDGLVSNVATVTIGVVVPVSPGVTFITHGYQLPGSDSPTGPSGWVTQMANAIAKRVPNPSIWTITVTGSPLTVPVVHMPASPDSGPNQFLGQYSGQTIVKLDWSQVAGGIYTTDEVAAAVAASLFSYVQNGKTWFDLPIHLIGHSRGASLLDELAKDLGQAGIWIDQLTTLDPHPIGSQPAVDYVFFPPNFVDAPMQAWKNVTFWDNYWENRAVFPQGQNIPGTHSIQEAFPDGGYNNNPIFPWALDGYHQDVHLWYQGTIDTSPGASDGSYPVPSDWYFDPQGPRDQTGFYYSSIVGGIRPSDGLWSAPGRQMIADLSQEVWPNIVSLTTDSLDERIGAGGAIPVTFSYQDYANGATITLYLDSNKNPYDGYESAYAVPVSWAATGADPSQQHQQIQTDAGIPLGSYFVFAKISDGTHTRFFYAPGMVTILPATSTALASSLDPSPFGQNVVFTATVHGGSGTPGGTVTFFDGTTALGSALLVGEVATFSTSTLALGTHGITASYSGDSTYGSSTSAVLSQLVTAATSTSVTSSPNPATFGVPVTFTVTVTADDANAGVPTGSVQLSEGAVVYATVALDATGHASFITSTLPAGSHTITANFTGTGGWLDSNYSMDQHVATANTTTALISSPNPSVFGQSVMLTATVSVTAPGAGIPTGTVTFKDGANTLATVSVDATGHATCPISTLPVGSRTITAVYSGDANFTGSASSAITQTVNKDGTTTTLSSSPNPSLSGQPVAFTAVVLANSPGSGIPAGTVTFKDKSKVLATMALDATGRAVFTTPKLSKGTHQITATYSGNASYLGSSSPPVTQTVNRGMAAVGSPTQSELPVFVASIPQNPSPERSTLAQSDSFSTAPRHAAVDAVFAQEVAVAIAEGNTQPLAIDALHRRALLGSASHSDASLRGLADALNRLTELYFLNADISDWAYRRR